MLNTMIQDLASEIDRDRRRGLSQPRRSVLSWPLARRRPQR